MPLIRDCHWAAFDDLFRRLLPGADAARAQQRFGTRAASLSAIYLPRFILMAQRGSEDNANLTCELQELEQTHRALTSALTTAWRKDAR